jgi:hypothetical protein
MLCGSVVESLEATRLSDLGPFLNSPHFSNCNVYCLSLFRYQYASLPRLKKVGSFYKPQGDLRRIESIFRAKLCSQLFQCHILINIEPLNLGPANVPKFHGYWRGTFFAGGPVYENFHSFTGGPLGLSRSPPIRAYSDLWCYEAVREISELPLCKYRWGQALPDHDYSPKRAP